MTCWERLQWRVAIRDGGATVLISWGSYRPNWLVHEHKEATVDLVEVTVGVEDDGGGLATCGRAMWQRTTAARSRQRRRGGDSSFADMRKVEREARQS